MRIASTVERRLLTNYRVDPEVLARVLPAPFRPQLVNGWAVGGICLIRLGQVRPAGLPAAVGRRSENAAHRIAVEWDGPDGVENGVYIPRRHSASTLVTAAGGRVFPGVHTSARFDVREEDDVYSVAFSGSDGTEVAVEAAVGPWTGSAVFADLEAASEFFRRSPLGLSATRDESRLDAVELRTTGWRLEPAVLRSVRSSFFDDRGLFPAGSAVPDGSFLMRDLPATWHAHPSMRLGRPEVTQPKTSSARPKRAARVTQPWQGSSTAPSGR